MSVRGCECDVEPCAPFPPKRNQTSNNNNSNNSGDWPHNDRYHSLKTERKRNLFIFVRWSMVSCLDDLLVLLLKRLESHGQRIFCTNRVWSNFFFFCKFLFEISWKCFLLVRFFCPKKRPQIPKVSPSIISEDFIGTRRLCVLYLENWRPIKSFPLRNASHRFVIGP